MTVLYQVQQREGMTSPDFVFHCPGCGNGHGVWVTKRNGHTGALWTWNGSLTKPTFQPSLLLTGNELTEKGWADYRAWLASEKTTGPDQFDSKPMRCHSVITDGRIHYCSDCTHALAGQVVDMVDMDALPAAPP